MKEQNKSWYIGLGIASLIYIVVVLIAKFMGNIGFGVMVGPLVGLVTGIAVRKLSIRK